MNLIKREPKQIKDTRPQTKDPWFLESVKNGIKATNVKESAYSIRRNKKIPVQYFEYDRIFGRGVFSAPLKVIEMFDELRGITPKTKGFIYDVYVYLYHNDGILKISQKDGEESFFSKETLRNQSVACYLEIAYANESDKIQSMIEELDAATSGRDTEDKIKRRIPYQDTE